MNKENEHRKKNEQKIQNEIKQHIHLICVFVIRRLRSVSVTCRDAKHFHLLISHFLIYF